MYWIPKLHKTPYKARFIANSKSCTTTKLSNLLTSCLTKIKEHVQRYCDKAYENCGINLFWSIKNSGEVLNKFEAKRQQASSISTYDFSTLYPTLPHNLIKDKLIPLIQKTFARERSEFWLVIIDMHSSRIITTRRIILLGIVRKYVRL